MGVDKKVRRDQLKSSKAMILLYGLPLLILWWYSLARFLPPSSRQAVPALLWQPGLLISSNSTTVLCADAAHCAEGTGQVIMLGFTRFGSDLMYVTLSHVFLTKMHALNHYLVRLPRPGGRHGSVTHTAASRTRQRHAHGSATHTAAPRTA